MEKLKNVFKNKKKWIVLILVIIVVAVTVIFVLFSNPVNSFISNLKSENIDKAKELYNKKVKGDIKLIADATYETGNLIDDYFEDFNQEKITYEKVKSLLENVEQIKISTDKNIKEKLEELELLNTSKKAYRIAIEYSNTKDYYNALTEFSKVIESDKNYEESKMRSEDILNNYKEDIFLKIEDAKNNKEYEKVLELLENLGKISGNNAELAAKIEVETKLVMDSFKNNQEVVITSAKPYSNYYSSSIDGISVLVKNNSSKVVKYFEVGMLAFDENGYPLQIEYKDVLKLGKGENVNIQSGATFGENNYYSVYYNEEKIKTAIACIIKVEYYDGTTWENPYYNFWLEQYRDKQYK